MLAGKTKPIKKLSPLTNHKNTKKGTVTGGFNRVSLFQQAEQSFDKLFGYNRQQSESFDNHSTMRNGSISEQLELQEQQIIDERRMNVSSQVGMNADVQISLSENIFEKQQESNISNIQSVNRKNKKEDK